MQKRNGARRTSIVDSFHKPALSMQVFIIAIQPGLAFATRCGFGVYLRMQCAHLDVPFLTRPLRFGPPVTFSSPRSSERKDLPANTFATKERWLSILKLNGCRKGRPVNSHGRGRLASCGRLFFPNLRQNKPALLKRIRTVCVEQNRRTNAVLSHCALNLREREFKTFGVGRERQKQTELLRTSLHRNRQHRNGDDWGRRRVRFEIEDRKSACRERV